MTHLINALAGATDSETGMRRKRNERLRRRNPLHSAFIECIRQERVPNAGDEASNLSNIMFH